MSFHWWLFGKQLTDRLFLIFKQDKEVPTNLMGDPLRLGQILLNLTNNARALPSARDYRK